MAKVPMILPGAAETSSGPLAEFHARGRALAKAHPESGAWVTLDIGGRSTPGFVPLEVSGVVAAISDGPFVIGGPFGAGEEISLGRTLVLVVDDWPTLC
ncbi:MlrC C-terminal domain-containing protein [Mesorhizobium abyssinicae]|uniref:MlrC C-terminal domain-containing protein n=1 Tax=Mesorhizobium abyssinicae TaxID=1209958 RepID=UPI0033994FE2